MFTCHACSRHVLDDAKQCPFCGAAQESEPSPVAVGFGGVLLPAVLGLALVSCGDPDPGDEGASTAESSATAGTEAGTTEDPGATSQGSTAAGETATPGDTFEAEAADYGGPTGEPPPDDTTGGTGGPSESTGSTGGDSGSSGSSSGPNPMDEGG